jgi:hypothetical protein
MRVRRSSFGSPLVSHTQSPRHHYPADLEAFGRGDADPEPMTDAFVAVG